MKKFDLFSLLLLTGICIQAQAQNLVYPTTQTTGGAYNSIFGISAGQQNTASNNVMIGQYAGSYNTTGQLNTFVGTSAGGSTTGSKNVMIGYGTGQFNNTGSENTYVGHSNALVGNGSQNTCLGAFTGNNTTTLGNENTLIGSADNTSSTLTGTINQTTLLGRLAKAYGNLTNATAIGYGAAVSASNALVLGNSSVNVGIGTSTPANKLHVVGDEFVTGKIGIGTNNFTQDATAKLIVNGKIVATEIEVKNVSADHVFNDTYKLRSLTEVEQFIKANKHLPDVAPASETEKGVKLAEFNTLLLQKIEELTLYVIQQQREIETLKAEIKK